MVLERGFEEDLLGSIGWLGEVLVSRRPYTYTRVRIDIYVYAHVHVDGYTYMYSK